MRKSFQFDIWTKNMLNTDYSSFYFEALGNKYVQTGKPTADRDESYQLNFK